MNGKPFAPVFLKINEVKVWFYNFPEKRMQFFNSKQLNLEN
jgi:hypothetical protein